MKIVDLCKKRRKLSDDEIEILERRLMDCLPPYTIVVTNDRKISKNIKHLYVIKDTMIPHRKNGPAIVFKNKSEMWLQYGQLHRENGMARVGILDSEEDNPTDYWIHGEWFPLKKYLKILGKESMINYL